MKFTELNEKSLIELAALGREKRQEIFSLRLQQAGSQLEKPSRLRASRRDIAALKPV